MSYCYPEKIFTDKEYRQMQQDEIAFVRRITECDALRPIRSRLRTAKQEGRLCFTELSAYSLTPLDRPILQII